jgi:dTMP kinase
MPDGPQTRFLALEGLDGAGTTTLVGLLADAIRARGMRVCATAEPSDGPVGLVCRAHVRWQVTLDPRTAALAFSADRSDHLARIIRPALDQGEWVVCDRYLLSTLAYQGSQGADREWILSLSSRFDVPDLTVFLDVPAPVQARRLAGRTRADRYEQPQGQDELRGSYLASIDLLRSRGDRIVVLDATQSPDALCRTILDELDSLA